MTLILADVPDPDERLTLWASTTLIWGKQYPTEEYAMWLRSAQPDQWHDAVENWNWDYGLTPVFWIATRDSCQAATALLIFYMAEPFYDERRWPEEEQLIGYIRERWRRGGYEVGDIGFDFRSGWDKAFSDRYLDLVPQSMRVSLPGRRLQAGDYEEGFPAQLFRK